MSSTQKPGDEHRSLPDDIALAAGMPRGHQTEGSLHDVPSPSLGSNHTGTQTHSIYAEGSHGSSAADAVKARASDVRDRAAEAASDIRDQLSDSAQNLRERASDAYDDARSWASDTHQEGRRRVSELSRRGTARIQDGRSAVEDFVSENPLLVGVVGLAAGLLIGALLPRTRTEDENVGPWADEVRDQGLRYARDVTHRGREFVASALDPENLNAAVQRATGGDEPVAASPASPQDPASKPH
ncbi:YqjD family protein [Methylobacterium sp. M6A4_1b]